MGPAHLSHIDSSWSVLKSPWSILKAPWGILDASLSLQKQWFGVIRVWKIRFNNTFWRRLGCIGKRICAVLKRLWAVLKLPLAVLKRLGCILELLQSCFSMWMFRQHLLKPSWSVLQSFWSVLKHRLEASWRRFEASWMRPWAYKNNYVFLKTVQEYNFRFTYVYNTFWTHLGCIGHHFWAVLKHL